MENLETRLNEVARIAVRLEQQTACPAQLLVAQWARRPRQLLRCETRRTPHTVVHRRHA